jgi:hypothetical protein
MMNFIKEYETYLSKIGDRKALYSLIEKSYHIKTALYPGSYIDISASLVIPNVTYIDNFKGAIKFFQHMDEIKDYIILNKQYDEAQVIQFFGIDYNESIDMSEVDLIISQFAGFVGQATKKYLRKGGILLCNDSHGDATLAYVDDDFEFIGVIDSCNQIVSSGLDKYFKFTKEKDIDIHIVRSTMKGPKYKLQPSNYIFRLK